MEWYGMIPALPKHTFGVLAHISSPWSAVYGILMAFKEFKKSKEY